MIKIRPIGGYILIEPDDSKKISSGGIHLASATKEQPQKGKVLAVGTGDVTDSGVKVEFNVKAGDIIMFAKFSPEEIEVDEKKYLLLRENAVLCVLEGKSETE